MMDFSGDGASNPTVFRPTTGRWLIFASVLQNDPPIIFGTIGDIPASADYDGDERADIALFRPSEGMWYYISSSTGQQVGQQWGVAGDIPIASAFVKLSSSIPTGTR